jgi:polyferredoxin
MASIEHQDMFPERLVLRARRMRASKDEAAHPTEAPTASSTMWVMWVAIYLPMFVYTPMIFVPAIGGWNGQFSPGMIDILKYSLWLILAACILFIGVALRRTSARTR